MNGNNTPFVMDNKFVFLIFGASGDLASLKIFPTIFELALQKRFTNDFLVLGYSRSKLTKKEFQDKFRKSIQNKFDMDEYFEKVLDDLVQKIDYISGEYDKLEDFKICDKYIQDKIDSNLIISYFAVPPFLFKPIIQNLSSIKNDRDFRLIIEKPFGEDEQSASDLFLQISELFCENDIYLLDHYLGKKPIRSILPLRSRNRALNTLLKPEEISNIQITAYEDMGVEDRIGYYDDNGVIKDMVQSHLLQILSLLTMNIPILQGSNDISNHKNSILSSLKFEEDEKNISIAQYENYPTKKSTPTSVELKLKINRQDYYDVPIYIRSGKNYAKKHTYICVELKKFEFQDEDTPPNRILIEFYPEEKISIKLVDIDGVLSSINDIEISDSLSCEGDFCLPSHGVLFLDVFKKDKRYFLSFNEIVSAWKFTDTVTSFIKKNNIKTTKYPIGETKMNKLDFKWYEGIS
ncbi:MAG: Glucose-6-phosphate 1-dehydrogenase (EC [uncultured Campylobacterales bacterium]|uniref:Glucose-6-phosphate 1-dehydrogenase (EC) n=1 Tax=uncultured Campylobacterales bacterium TaxID=352960 RepID=A0A6S6STW7_9BACT|nr:MAG: Glucose-6-phosphate 1-dehydrogenase (EC [uncultured Campylobacterales bacterium]